MTTLHTYFWRTGIAFATLALMSACDVTPEDGSGALGGGGGSQSPDPVVVDFPVAYVSRPIPVDEDGVFVPHDVLDPGAFHPGARLILKERASVPAAERDITSVAWAMDPEDPNFDPDFVPLYDVKDVSASPDGSKLIFAMRGPEDPDLGDEEQPTWNIWEYDIELDELRRLIFSDLTAEEGQDIGPAYLPDGRIIFTSTRQRRSKAILLDENKPQFGALVEGNDEDEAFLLHIMDEDGIDIQQVSYNQAHDMYPTITSDGKVIFLRYDNVANRDRLSLYRANPDGSQLELLYGYHSQNSGTNDAEVAFVKPQEMPDGRIMVNMRPRVAEKLGGDMMMIDTFNFIDLTQPVDSNPGAAGPAQESASVLPVVSDGTVSSHGYFSSAYPMVDGTDRFLVSWSTCRVLGYRLGIYVEATGDEDPDDPDQLYALINDLGEYVGEDGLVSQNAVFVARSELSNFPCTDNTILLPQIPESEPAYGVWVYDTVNATQSPVVLAEDGMMFTDAIVLEPRFTPAHIEPLAPGDSDPAVFGSEELYNDNLGVLHIRNVYDLDGTDEAPGGIAALADPAQTSASQRPARFIRITKAVSMPSDEVYDFDNSAFGRAGNQMKDILGYVPVEPDGSAMFKVPADVAFAISLLDENGKRISVRHQNWMSVRPGEVRHCNGCHTQNSELPHGRLDAEPPSSNSGALANAHFNNTVVVDQFDTPQPPPEVGETMAQYWARLNGPRTPSVHIKYTDDWTDPAVRPKDVELDYDYSDLASGAPPLAAVGCMSDWNALCRIVINYMEHIQPLWDAPRVVVDPADPMVVLADNTCTACHSSVDAMGTAMIPAGNTQLDLSATMSDVQNDYLTSYAELFFNDDAQELNENGILQNEQIQLIVNGVPQIEALDTTGALVNVDEDIVVQDVQLIIADVPQYEVAGTGEVPGTVSFDDIQSTIFSNPVNALQSCRNCHTGPTADDGSFGLNLDPAFAYAELTDMADPLVIPFDPANSVLIQRLQGTITPQMPLTGGPLSTAEIQMVIDWIDYGAPETGTGSLPCGTDCPTVVPGPIDDPNVILDINGNPVPYMVPEFELVLDVDGNTVPFMVASGRQFNGLLSPNGALASQGFFDVFEMGGGTVDHRGFLNEAELKFIAEWLDIGGQYYNNPFDAPAN